MNQDATNLVQANVRNGSQAIARYSAKASAVTVAKMLDFAREMLLVSEPLSQRQSDFWIFELRVYRSDLIQRAFYEWVRTSKFMPVPAEIIRILEKLDDADKLDRRIAEDAAKIEECREIRERLKAAGEPYGLAQVRKLMGEALERIKKEAPPPDPTRIPILKERLARAQAEREARRRRPPATAADPARSEGAA